MTEAEIRVIHQDRPFLIEDSARLTHDGATRQILLSNIRPRVEVTHGNEIDDPVILKQDDKSQVVEPGEAKTFLLDKRIITVSHQSEIVDFTK